MDNMILNNNLSLNLCVMLSDAVHTEGESLQDGLGKYVDL